MDNSASSVKNEAEKVKEYRLAAEQGATAAQINLGLMYEHGRGVAQEDAEAVHWCRLAAEQGDATAQASLGWMYDTGRGVAQNEAEAVQWYRKAADQGEADAQNNLGVMYETGRGVAQSEAEAVQWYRKAADQGQADAQNNLGVMYEYGRGVAQDYMEAVKWHLKAADQGYAMAQNNLGINYITIQAIQNYQEGHTWSLKAYKQGEKSAGCYLGILYAYGLGIERSFQEALKYYREASEDNYPLAQILLGICYLLGIEGQMDIDVKKAYALFKKAAVVSEKYQSYTYDYLIGFFDRLSDSGEINASLMLAIVYQEGLLGIIPNEANAVKALQYYEKAVKIAHNPQMAAIFDNLDKISNSFIRNHLKNLKETLEKSKNPLIKALEEAVQRIEYPDLAVIKEIAAGNFGTVWSGKWLGTPVAIKKPHRNDEEALRALNEHYQQGLMEEAAMMARLHHPNVVKLYGIVTQPEFCIVMELMTKGTLYNLLESAQPLDWSFRYRIGFDVAQGLRYLHRLKISHRDLKSPNILLDNDYRAKLSDYGTSYSAQSLYSPFWLAPELLLLMINPDFKATVGYNQACDVYSFGVVLWELASRTAPKNISPHELITGKRQEIPAETPSSMAVLMGRCWAKKQEDRPVMDVVVQEMEANLVSPDNIVAESSLSTIASGADTSLPTPPQSTRSSSGSGSSLSGGTLSTGRSAGLGFSFFAPPRPDTSQQEEPLPEEPDESYSMKAKHHYTAKKPGQLSFAKNDELTVLNDEGNWWHCELRGERGVVPRNYLVPMAAPTFHL